MTLFFLIACTAVRPMTTQEAEASDTLSESIGSGGDIDGDGRKDADQGIFGGNVEGLGPVMAVEPVQTPDNANPTQAISWRGFGGTWVAGFLSVLPIYGADGNVTKWGSVFDDGLYRIACATAAATDGSDAGWCQHSEGISVEDYKWLAPHSMCNGPIEYDIIFVVEDGRIGPLTNAQLGELDMSDCED